MGLFSWIQRDFAVRTSDRFFRQGKSNNALEVIEAALSKFPLHTDLMIQKIWLLADMKRFDEALAELDLVLPSSPKHAVLQMLKGEVFLKMGQSEKAKETLLTALSLSGENIRIEYLLGLAYVALNDMDKASQYFESSIKYDKLLVQSRLLAMAERYLFMAQKGSDRL